MYTLFSQCAGAPAMCSLEYRHIGTLVSDIIRSSVSTVHTLCCVSMDELHVHVVLKLVGFPLSGSVS